MTDSVNSSILCYYEKHQWLEEKFYLISVCGTFIALLGILANIATALVFKRPKMRSPSNIYLKALAICDCFLLITAVLLYSVEYFYEYFDNLQLYNLWYSYVKYCYPFSHAAQTGSIYITMSVTLERYLAVVHPNRTHLSCQASTTTQVIIGVIIFAIIFNFSKFFEIDVVVHPNCVGFGSLALQATPLLSDDVYRFVYSLWLSQLVQVLIPFLTLLIFNTAIAISVRRHMVRQKRRFPRQRTNLTEMKERSRDATIILIVVVFIFLVCNSWGLVITLMEAFYGVPALIMKWPKFYAFSREAVNFLAIVHSSINFVIYYIFGKDFRSELESMLGSNRLYYLTRMAFEHLTLAKRLTCDAVAVQPITCISGYGRCVTATSEEETAEETIAKNDFTDSKESSKDTGQLVDHALSAVSCGFRNEGGNKIRRIVSLDESVQTSLMISADDGTETPLDHFSCRSGDAIQMMPVSTVTT